MSMLAAAALTTNAGVRFVQGKYLGHGEKYALAATMLLAAAAAIKQTRSQRAVPRSS